MPDPVENPVMNPNPVVNPIMNPNVSRIPAHEIIAQLRKYDGSKDAKEFLSRYKYDLRFYGLTFEWAIRNFDRVLLNDASRWWEAQWHNIEELMDTRNTEDEFKALFEIIEDDFLRMFDHSAQESTYRRKNKAISFKLGDDPTKYVTQKLEILRLINPSMTESKKITQIIKGLSYELRQTLVLQNIGTVHELLTKLRNLAEIYEDDRSRTSRRSNSHNFVQTPVQSSSSRANPSSSHFLQKVEPLPPNPQQSGPKYPKGKNLVTNDGQPICNFCQYSGHLARDCIELKTKRSSENPNRNTNYSRGSYNRGYGRRGSRGNGRRFNNYRLGYYNNPNQQLHSLSQTVENVENYNAEHSNLNSVQEN